MLKYLKSEQNNLVIGDGILLILNNKHCGACDQKTIDFIHSNFFNAQAPKYVIISQKDKDIEKQFSHYKNLYFFVDNGQFARYGLESPYSSFFIYKDDSLKYWDIIKVENLNDVQKRLNIFKINNLWDN